MLTGRSITQSRDYYLTLLDKYPVLVWRSDTNAKRDYFNQAWLEFTGRRMDQEIGDGWAEGVHPDDLAGCLQDFLAAFHARRPLAIEYRLRCHDGEYRWILDQGSAFHDLDDQFAGYLGSCFDITARKEAELALKNSHAQLRALSTRLQSVREEESERMAREIHDELGQALTGLNMDINWIKQKLEEIGSPQLRLQLDQRFSSMTKLVESTARSVQRISTQLRPAMLDDLGLTATLEWQAEEFAARTGIRCRWKPKPAGVELDRKRATAVFRIFQEILTNVARHAQARSLELTLVQNRGELVLKVADDGKGFNTAKLRDHKSLGLLGMRERAAFVGGSLEILSAPGKGTRITGKFPVAGPGRNGKLKAGRPHDQWNKNTHRR